MLEKLKADPLWTQLKVVQQGKVYEVPSYWIGDSILAANAVLDDLFRYLSRQSVISMPKHILFVCKSCKFKSEQDHAPDLPDGTQLLNQLQTLHQTWSHQADLEIREVDCLWTCSRPCSVAFSAPDKATYLFINVPATEAEALLQFGQLYLASKNGNIPWKQFPEVLQSTEIAKIPPLC